MVDNDENLVCPRCGNINIKMIGWFYQCQAIRGNRDLKSCGYVAEKHMFSPQKRF